MGTSAASHGGDLYFKSPPRLGGVPEPSINVRKARAGWSVQRREALLCFNRCAARKFIRWLRVFEQTAPSAPFKGTGSICLMARPLRLTQAGTLSIYLGQLWSQTAPTRCLFIFAVLFLFVPALRAQNSKLLEPHSSWDCGMPGGIPS